MSENIDRNRESYTQKTRTLISAISRAYFNGDEDAAWDRYFVESEKLLKTWPDNLPAPETPNQAVMWTRPLRK